MLTARLMSLRWTNQGWKLSLISYGPGSRRNWVFREIWSLAFGLQWLVAHNLTSWFEILAMFNLNLHHALCGWDLNVWSRHISFNHIWEQNCRNIYKWSSATTFATARKVLDFILSPITLCVNVKRKFSLFKSECIKMDEQPFWFLHGLAIFEAKNDSRSLFPSAIMWGFYAFPYHI